MKKEQHQSTPAFVFEKSCAASCLWRTAQFQFGIAIIGVVVFVGLTAWDTQRIKEIYLASDDDSIGGKKAIMGALALYLDFLNIFLLLLQLTGNRRR